MKQALCSPGPQANTHLVLSVYCRICLTPFNLHVYALFLCCSKFVDTKALFFQRTSCQMKKEWEDITELQN